VALQVVQKTGARYSFGEERLGQGRENAREYLKERPDVAAAIERRIRETLALGQPVPFTPGNEYREAGGED
jgi:recombination protein RecA